MDQILKLSESPAVQVEFLKCSLCSAWSCSSSSVGFRPVFSSFFSVLGRHRSKPQRQNGLQLTACKQVRSTDGPLEMNFFYVLTAFIVRSMEHCLFPQRRTPDNERQAFNYNSTPGRWMARVLRFQGQQVCWALTTVAHDSRRKGRREVGQVRRPDSCHMGALFQRLSHIFRCGRKTQL